MKKAGYIAVLLLLFFTGNAQVHYIDTVQFIDRTTPLPPHPRILLLKGEEEELKKTLQATRRGKKYMKISCCSAIPSARCLRKEL